MVAFRVREYISLAGNNLYRDWLDRLDVATRARIQARVFRFEQGNIGDVKGLGGGLCEARFTFGAGYRLYFGNVGDRLVLLLMGGDKSSQQKDIKQARQLWQEYLGRKSNG